MAIEPELSVVVPACNEADSLVSLVAEIREALDGRWSYEIIVVDDGSHDATQELLRETRRSCPWLRVLRHGRRLGQSAAVLNGVQAARAPLIATLDGDGQNDPADIPRLLSMIRDQPRVARPGMIVGHRQRRRDTRWKIMTSKIANGVRRLLLADETPDSGSGLKVFPREVFMSLPTFDHMHRFLPALVRRAGLTVRSVPVNHRPRKAGRPHYGTWSRLWAGVWDLLGVFWLTRRPCARDAEEVPCDAD